MYKLIQATYKEFLLLKRDFGGLIILFVMPLILVVAVTLIQNSTFQQINEAKIPVLFVDNDGGELSKSIVANLEKNGALELITKLDNQLVNEETAKELVLEGAYQMALILPKDLSQNLAQKVNQNVSKIMIEFGLEEQEEKTNLATSFEKQEIKIIFDPATQLSFKNGVRNAIDKMISKIETESIYSAFQKAIGAEDGFFDAEEMIVITEVNPVEEVKEIKPNAVQHNVPAWTLFAIFFIILPLSITIVKEKNQGTFVRLKSFPTSPATLLGGKIIVYLAISLLQFTAILLVGLFLFPYIGLPSLNVSGSYFLLYLMALFIGLAAIGFGILIGTIASTTEQAAPFGATSVVILAAIGGVWVPTFLMPETMQVFAKLTPMNWGLSGFYDIILRNGSLLDILPEISYLTLFFIILTAIAIRYDKKKNEV